MRIILGSLTSKGEPKMQGLGCFRGYGRLRFRFRDIYIYIYITYYIYIWLREDIKYGVMWGIFFFGYVGVGVLSLGILCQ